MTREVTARTVANRSAYISVCATGESPSREIVSMGGVSFIVGSGAVGTMFRETAATVAAEQSAL